MRVVAVCDKASHAAALFTAFFLEHLEVISKSGVKLESSKSRLPLVHSLSDF